MKCDAMEILLSAYIDGEVTTQERLIVEEHVTVCPSCRTIMASFAHVHKLYQEMEIKEAPPGFRQRVVQRIEAKPRFAFSWRLPRLAYVFSFSLLVLLSVAMIALHVRKERQPQQASLNIDVYAEDILFDQATLSVDEIFSVRETSTAEEILDTIQFVETDTSLFFGTDPPSQHQVPRTFKRTQYV
jgi:hypothetical protein